MKRLTCYLPDKNHKLIATTHVNRDQDTLPYNIHFITCTSTAHINVICVCMGNTILCLAFTIGLYVLAHAFSYILVNVNTCRSVQLMLTLTYSKQLTCRYTLIAPFSKTSL